MSVQHQRPRLDLPLLISSLKVKIWPVPLTANGVIHYTSNYNVGYIIPITNGESLLPAHVCKASRHRSIHDSWSNQVHSITQILHFRSRGAEKASYSPFRCGLVGVVEFKIARQRTYDYETFSDFRRCFGLQ